MELRLEIGDVEMGDARCRRVQVLGGTVVYISAACVPI